MLSFCSCRYRRPKHQYHNHKSEVSARHSSFRRGCAYLERYCLLIAFGAYLEAEGTYSSVSFAEWLDARPELKQALANIHNSPATALAAIPVAAVPVLYRSVRGSEQVTPAEQEEVGMSWLFNTGCYCGWAQMCMYVL